MSGGRKAGNVVPLKDRPCPLCGKPEAAPHRPFCSRRCADLDLGHWLKEDYRVESDEAAGPDDEAPDDEAQNDEAPDAP